ncbi:MAG: type II toxin-antitoxin system mRNA interferase toxin, RelE/StbE family [Candidatus Nealsonbacteria bacterium]|nr:type II toxin-antitoxin system mRNA interferase toxin, RelE/StbE family [Candidatus Nealsonbacteria bacterium]
MTIFYSPEFKRKYKRLPLEIQRKAEEKEIIFRNDPFDSRLKTHKLHGRLGDFLAFSIDERCRIIFTFLEKDKVKFYAIGGHEIY